MISLSVKLGQQFYLNLEFKIQRIRQIVYHLKLKKVERVFSDWIYITSGVRELNCDE